MKTHNKERIVDASFIIIISFLAFEFVRPQDQFGIIGIFKIPMILTLLGAILFIRGNKQGVFREPILKYIIFFIMVIALSIIKASNHNSTFTVFQSMSIFLISAIIPFIQYMNTKEKIFLFFKYWVAINVVFALFVISNGGTGTGGFNKDENDAALVLNAALPFAYYLAASKNTQKNLRLLYWLAFTIIISASILTFSRGGFLGIAAIGLIIFIQSKNKAKTIFISLILSLLFVTVGYKLLPEAYIADMKTISDTEDGTRNERLYSWDIGFQMFKKNPILGVGAGNYPWTVSRYAHLSSMYNPDGRSLGGRAAHSMYFTLIPELGLLGIIAFIGLFHKTMTSMRSIVKRYKDIEDDRSDFANLAQACFSSLFTCLITGAFISVLYYPVIWFYCTFALGLLRVAIPHNTTIPNRTHYA